MGSTIKKHNLSIDNLLDELEEQQGDHQEKKKKEQEQKQEKEKFLNLFEVYQDQFWQIKEFPGSRNETWQQQLSLMEQELKKSQIYCGITSIDQVDETVDFDLHEVIEVIEAYCILLNMDYAGKRGYFQEIMQELTGFVNRYSVYIEENLKMLVSALAAFSAMSGHTLEEYQTIDRLHQLLERICHSSDNIVKLRKIREYFMFERIGYDERLSDTVKRGLEAFLETADMDAVLFKYAKLDVKLCMIEERQEILPQLEILKKEYSPYYEKEEDFFRQLESGQGLEDLKQKLLKLYYRLSGEVSGGFYFKKYPQEAIRGRGKIIHAGTESSPYARSGRKIGRNESCPCGSGRKYKHCCGRKI